MDLGENTTWRRWKEGGQGGHSSGVRFEKLRYDFIRKKVGHHKITLSAKSIAHRALRKSSFFLAKELSFILEK